MLNEVKKVFPKISRSITKSEEIINVKYLIESQELVLDRVKCTGCGTCARVCPKEAISRGPVGASKRFPTTEDIIPSIYDPKKCVFCGTCVYMCPFSALKMNINGKLVEIDKIPIVEKKVVPKLEFEAKKLDCGSVVKQYATGDISIVNEECAGGCETCAEVCPSGAITVPPKPEHGWEKSINVVVDPEKCVFCGACDNACPTGAVKLEIKEIKSSGEFSDLFWPPLVERFKAMRGPKLQEEQSK